MRLFRIAPLCMAWLALPLFGQTPGSFTCSVDHSRPTDAEKAVADRDYFAAEKLARLAIEKGEDSPAVRLSLVRAMIAKDEVTEAQAQASASLSANPKSALAYVAMGEADLRAGHLEQAVQDTGKALALDHCDGRAVALLARLKAMQGMNGSAARGMKMAHGLRPEDPLITREWLSLLPRKERLAAIQPYLVGPEAVSGPERAILESEKAHLESWHPGDCQITLAKPQTSVLFMPIGPSEHPRAYGLETAFDGKTRTMEIDTGASGITLSPTTAAALGLKPEVKTQARGFGDDGAVNSYLTHVAKIQIGGITLTNCPVEVLEKDSKGHDRLEWTDGLIGIDVFAQWMTTLDFPHKQLVVQALPPLPGVSADDDTPRDVTTPAEMKDWTPVIRINHDLLVPGILGKGTMHYFVVDTGAGTTVVSMATLKEAGKPIPLPGSFGHGVSGEIRQAYFLDDVKMRFGNFMLPKERYYGFDITNISHAEGVEVGGFMGFPTLSRLTVSIDYRDHLLKLSYDPDHDPAMKR